MVTPQSTPRSRTENAARLGISKRKHKERVKSRIIDLESRLSKTEELLESAMVAISTISNEVRVVQLQRQAADSRACFCQTPTSVGEPHESPSQPCVKEVRDPEIDTSAGKDFMSWDTHLSADELSFSSALFAQLEMGTGNMTDLVDYRLYTAPLVGEPK